MDPYIVKRLLRRPWLSLCSLLLSWVLCLLTGSLLAYRQDQNRQLENVQQAQEVVCVVTNAKGTSITGLRMKSEMLDFVLQEDSPLAPHIRQLQITKEFKYSAPDLGLQNDVFTEDIYPILGVNSPGCADSLDPAMGANVTYFSEDFYGRTDPICLVSEDLYYKLDGQPLRLHVTDPFLGSQLILGGKGEVTLTVAGYYQGIGVDIYLPFGTAMELAVTLSGCRSCDSVSFLAADNRQLEALSQAASACFGVADPTAPGAPTSGYALAIHDEQYRSVVAVLRQNILRAQLLLPALLLVSAALGFLASFLATRNEIRTYALMRTLGMTGRKLFFSILREQLMPAILAALLALPLTRTWAGGAIYLACYFMGCTVCILRTVRVPPTAILREQE